MKNKQQKVLQNPILNEGGLSVDDRGEVGFVNEFDMQSVRRFYTVCNHKVGLVRAWHAHKIEKKFVTVVNGAAIVAAVRIDNWKKPSKNLVVNRYVLSAKKPVKNAPKAIPNILTLNTQSPITVPLILVEVKF